MMPMDLTSTPFITYQEINVDETDLFEDAWGIRSEFSDVLNFLGSVDADPGDCLVERILGYISEKD